MTRSALLLLLAAVSCAPETTQTCPGEPVARFAFEAAVPTPEAPLPAGLDPEPAYTDCAAELNFPVGDDAPRFTATLSHVPDSDAGALCRTGGQILYGTRTGLRWEVEAASNGAVLDACGSTCVARSRIVVRGDVAPDADAPTTFGGLLVEQLSRTDGDCARCELPCAMRYVLAGAPEVPQP